MRQSDHATQTDASQDAGLVLVLDSERGPDASLLMSHLAARQRAVEIVRDEVSAMRRLIHGGIDLLVLVTPTSPAAATDLREAAMTVRHPPVLAGWDRHRRALRPMDEPAPPVPSVAPAAMSAASDAGGEWDTTTEMLSSAELDALLGDTEPCER